MCDKDLRAMTLSEVLAIVGKAWAEHPKYPTHSLLIASNDQLVDAWQPCEGGGPPARVVTMRLGFALMAKTSADRKVQKASKYDFDKGGRPKRVMGTLARRRLRAPGRGAPSTAAEGAR